MHPGRLVAVVMSAALGAAVVAGGAKAAGGRASSASSGVDKGGHRVSRAVRYRLRHYTNPLAAVRRLRPERIDMGVDYTGSGPLLALGNGTVTLATDHDRGWPGGGIVVYQLSQGLFAGKYVYVAENITVRVEAGQTVRAGERIATLHKRLPHLETGWAAGKGDKTLADVDHHRCPCGDPGGWSTIEGRNFDHLLVLLGAPSGYLQRRVPKQRMPPGWPRLH